MERKLCTIQTIRNIENIKNADSLEVATVLGWKVVVKKGEFNVGEKICYAEVDSILPDKPEFEFLKPRGYRIKSIKLRGQISQGIIFPLSILPPDGEYIEGQDVTDVIGIKKYEPIIPENLRGELFGKKPFFVPTTDEIRLQTYPELLNEIRGLKAYRSIKCDGTSCSIYFNNDFERNFGVCSRNMELKEGDTAYWKIAKKYNMMEKLKNEKQNIVFQGELCGPSIQKNRLGLSEIDWFIFDVWYPNENRYAYLGEMIDICKYFGLKTVPIESIYDSFDFNMETLLSMAEGKYNNTSNEREGNVWRCVEGKYSEILNGRLSFKVLSNKFLLKED